VVCGEIKTLNNDQFNLLNPILIIEVLSPSTRNYDRGMKFQLYKDIPSFTEYLLVDSTARFVEVHFKNSNSVWQSIIHTDIAEDVELSSISVRIPMHAIYDGVLSM